MSVHVLCLTPVPPSQKKCFGDAGYILHDHQGLERRSSPPANASEIRAIITNGANGVTAAMIESLPNLEIVCAMAVGVENIDFVACDARGLVVTHGPGTNATAVADHAIALMFAVARNIIYGDATARANDWSNARRPYPLVVNKNLDRSLGRSAGVRP